MIKALELINKVLAWIFDLLSRPLAPASPLLGLVVFSMLSGVLLVFLYGQVSSQSRIKEIKRHISSLLLECVLYRHDVRVCLSAQGKLLYASCRYFLLALPPLLVLLIPGVLIMAQLNLRYAYRPVEVGEAVLVSAKVRESVALDSIVLLGNKMLEAAPSLSISAERELWWRLTPRQSGVSSFYLKSGDKLYEEKLVAAQAPRISPRRGSTFLDLLLYPGREAFLAAAPLSRVEIHYPEKRYQLFGRSFHWLFLFFVISLVSGLAASRPLGVSL